jgi:hypothetical protein
MDGSCTEGKRKGQGKVNTQVPPFAQFFALAFLIGASNHSSSEARLTPPALAGVRRLPELRPLSVITRFERPASPLILRTAACSKMRRFG